MTIDSVEDNAGRHLINQTYIFNEEDEEVLIAYKCSRPKITSGLNSIQKLATVVIMTDTIEIRVENFVRGLDFAS